MSRKVKIGYIIQQFPPEVGAGSARAAELGTRWVEDGADVRVVTAMPNRPVGRIYPEYRGHLFSTETWQGIRVYRSWLYASPKHGFARTLLNNVSFMGTSLLRGVNALASCDVLIASSPPFFPHVSGVLLSGFHRIPLILEVRDLWPDYLVGMGLVGGWKADALYALEGALLRRADRVVVVTESFRRRIEAKGVMPDRIEVIPNGVDTELYFKGPDAPPPFPALDRRPGDFLVGYLGNFGAGQGLEVVVEAAACLSQQGHDAIRFVLAGDGPTKAAIVALTRGRGLPLEIHPPILKDQTRAFYNACDVCLVPLAPIPIFQETIPSKIFEIMACESLVIACLDGEGRRIIEESGAGLVTPPGDPEVLARAIVEAQTMKAHDRVRCGKDARAYVKAHYERHGLADRYLETIESCVQLRRILPVPSLT